LTWTGERFLDSDTLRSIANGSMIIRIGKPSETPRMLPLDLNSDKLAPDEWQFKHPSSKLFVLIE
jgi:hypothetical protein